MIRYLLLTLNALFFATFLVACEPGQQPEGIEVGEEIVVEEGDFDEDIGEVELTLEVAEVGTVSTPTTEATATPTFTATVFPSPTATTPATKTATPVAATGTPTPSPEATIPVTETPTSSATPAGTPTLDPTVVAEGDELFQELGCNTCHPGGGAGTGPSLVGLLGREVELESGETIVADEAYIRQSILHPNEQVVAGYPAIMPSFEGQVSDRELEELIAYINSLDR